VFGNIVSLVAPLFTLFSSLSVEGMDWIKLDQDRDRQWALVNVVMNLQVPQNVENFLNS
jgi:hypothetical protein